MPFNIVRNDITKMNTDAIVNPANPLPVVGDGVDRAVYTAAGMERMLKDRRKVGYMGVGQVFISKGYGLPCRYVIHASGPAWADGTCGEREDLEKTYTAVLELARKKHLKSVSFPLLGAGSYGFPVEVAVDAAISAIGRFLLRTDMNVILVVFGRPALRYSGGLFDRIDSFIDDNYVAEKKAEEYVGYSMHMPEAPVVYGNYVNLSEARRAKKEEPVPDASLSMASQAVSEAEWAEEAQKASEEEETDEEKARRSMGPVRQESARPKAYQDSAPMPKASSSYMPRPGHRSEGVPHSSYDDLEDSYRKASKEYARPPKKSSARSSDAAPSPGNARPRGYDEYDEAAFSPGSAPKAGKARRLSLAPETRKDRKLESLMEEVGETFQEKLFRLIDERGLKDADVYRRANLDRKLFSKIRGRRDYQPSKKTVMALCIALCLNIDQATDLMARAGFAFSPGSRFDIIVRFYIVNGMYEINSINLTLFEYGEDCLGA